jgi:hypothetical protein
MREGPDATSAAAHPMANEQLPAGYHFKVGGFECTVVSDGPLKLGKYTAALFKGISQERIDEIVAANFLDKNDLTVGQNAMVVNTGSKLVLIDTGMGFVRSTARVPATCSLISAPPALIQRRWT